MTRSSLRRLHDRIGLVVDVLQLRLGLRSVGGPFGGVDLVLRLERLELVLRGVVQDAADRAAEEAEIIETLLDARDAGFVRRLFEDRIEGADQQLPAHPALALEVLVRALRGG